MTSLLATLQEISNAVAPKPREEIVRTHTDFFANQLRSAAAIPGRHQDTLFLPFMSSRNFQYFDGLVPLIEEWIYREKLLVVHTRADAYQMEWTVSWAKTDSSSPSSAN